MPFLHIQSISSLWVDLDFTESGTLESCEVRLKFSFQRVIIAMPLWPLSYLSLFRETTSTLGCCLLPGQPLFVFVLPDLPTWWQALSSPGMSELCQGSRWEGPENVGHPHPGPSSFTEGPPWPQERTLVTVKPDGVQRRLVGTVIQRFEMRGLRLVGMKMLQVSALGCGAPKVS